MDYKKQNKQLREKLKLKDKELEKKDNDIELITLECQKSIKAFRSAVIGISLPQAIQDYADLHDLRNKQLPIKPGPKPERNYLA